MWSASLAPARIRAGTYAPRVDQLGHHREPKMTEYLYSYEVESVHGFNLGEFTLTSRSSYDFRRRLAILELAKECAPRISTKIETAGSISRGLTADI